MDKIIHIENIFQYNERVGVETLHPLVSVIDMSQAVGCRTSARPTDFIPYS